MASRFSRRIVRDVTPPSAVTLVAAANGWNRIDLTWSAASDAYGVAAYLVYRDGALVATLGSVTAYSDTGLSASRAYAYYVRARDAAGNVGAASNVATATTAALDHAPSWTDTVGNSLSVAAGQPFSYTLTATDPDVGDVIAISEASDAANLATINPQSGTTRSVTLASSGLAAGTYVVELDLATTPPLFGVTVEDGGDATWATVFADGELAAGAALTVGGVYAQVDAKTTWPSGSVKHAIVSGSLAVGAQSVYVTAAQAGSVSLPVGFGASIAITGVGTLAFTTSGATEWLAGSECCEWIQPDTVIGGTFHGAMHVRAYKSGKVRVDFVIENGYAKSAATADDIAVTLTAGTASKSVTYLANPGTRWRHTLWFDGAGSSCYVKQSTRRLMRLSAVPKMRKLVSPSSGWSAFDSANPDPQPHVGYAATGPGIAPLRAQYWSGTDWGDVQQTREASVITTEESPYLVSEGHRAAWTHLMVNANAAGAFSVHYRDALTKAPIQVADNATWSSGSAPWVRSGDNGSALDAWPKPPPVERAHPLASAYVAYLVTGDFFYLEEQQFWSAWFQLELPPARRAMTGLSADGDDGLVWQSLPTTQTTAQRILAWGIKFLAQAAYVSPDADPLKAKLLTYVANNIAHWSGAGVNRTALGTVLSNAGDPAGYEGFPLFYQQYLTAAFGHMRDLGYDCADFLGYLCIVQRDTWTVGGAYNYRLASGYKVKLGSAWNVLDYSTWAAAYTANAGVSTLGGWLASDGFLSPLTAGQTMFNYPDKGASYQAYASAALAVAIDALIAPGTSWATWTTSADYPSEATLKILPAHGDSTEAGKGCIAYEPATVWVE